MLEQIIPILQKDGWRKDLLVDSAGHKCLLGAVNFAYTGDAHWPPHGETEEMANDIKALAAAGSQLFPTRIDGALYWGDSQRIAAINNHADTTFEDIELIVNTAMQMQLVSA